MFEFLAARITNPQINSVIADLSPKQFINTIFPQILNIGFVIGAIIFLFMLIGGGIAYITSKGDPGSVDEAKKKITNSLLGLLIQFSVYLIIGIANWFFDINLGFGFNINLPLGTSFTNLSSPPNAQSTLSSAIEVILIVAVVAFLAMFLYGGIKWIGSKGKPDEIREAKDTIVASLVGLAIVFAIFFIGYLVDNYFNTSIGPDSSIGGENPVGGGPIPTSASFVPPISQQGATCQLSGNLTPQTGVANSYSINVASASLIDRVIVEVTDVDYATSSPNWTSVYNSNPGSTSFNDSFSYIFTGPGVYYLACRVVYAGFSLECSSNPWCEWTPNPPSSIDCSQTGLADCGVGDVLTVSVDSGIGGIVPLPSPTPTPIPTPTPTPFPTSTPFPTLTPTPTPKPTNTPTPVPFVPTNTPVPPTNTPTPTKVPTPTNTPIPTPTPFPSPTPTPVPVFSCKDLIGYSVRPDVVSPDSSIEIQCDYGTILDCIAPGNDWNGCFWIGYNGTAARFICKAPSTLGDYQNFCNIYQSTGCQSKGINPQSCEAGTYKVI